MKAGMRKTRRAVSWRACDLPLLFMSVCIGALLYFCLGIGAQIQHTDRINSCYLSSHALTFVLTEDRAVSSDEISALLSPGNRLFRLNADGSSLLLFAYNGHTDFDVAAGRQFAPDDLSGAAALQLSGADLGDAPGVETIGVLGVSFPSRLDSMRIVLPTQGERDVLRRGNWVIDGRGHVKQDWARLKSRLGEGYIEVIPTEYTGTMRMYHQSAAVPILTGAVLLLALLGYGVMADAWLYGNRTLVFVLYLAGVCDRQILLHLGKRFLPLLAGGSFLGGFVAMLAFRDAVAYISWQAVLGCLGVLAAIFALAMCRAYRALRNGRMGQVM